MGRPQKDIDGEWVFKLAKLGCTQDDIAEFMGCDQATISRRFSSEFNLGRGACKISLRRAQFKSALAGCAAMLIHLGKQHLGQTDRMDVMSGGEPVTTRWFERVHNPRDSSVPPSVKANGVCQE